MKPHTWIVTGASGGLGASTLAAALAGAVAAGPRSVVLVDLDPCGGGLDVTCGIDHLPGLRWPDLARVRGRVDPGRLVGGLPRRGSCTVLSHGPSRVDPALTAPAPQVVQDVLCSLRERRGDLVLDLPRWVRPPHDIGPVTWVLLSGTRTRELADLDALVARCDEEPVVERSRLVVATTGPLPAAELLEAMEDHVGLPHVGHVARVPRLASAMERGSWPGGRLFRGLVDALVDRAHRRGAA